MKTAYPPDKDTPIVDGMPTVGWGPFRCQWYSFCSAHQRFDVSCSRCRAGSWHNCWSHEVGHFIYENDPTLWRWWANRPELMASFRNLIESAFKNKNAK
jgi:hypothetical protein